MGWHKRAAALWVVLVLLLAGTLAQAQIAATNKMSDVRGTKHNFSSVADGTTTPSGKVPARTVKATTETQVCVFCHTPHEATPSVVAPLWNRVMSSTTYVKYESSSMDASVSQPGGTSKLCLSCHDGTMGIDKVNALNGAKDVTITMGPAGSPLASPVLMPGANTTGFTRSLGTNLSNDHPISFTYDATLATSDGELRGPGSVVYSRSAGAGTAAAPKMPLEGGQVQCTTCHDPHLSDKTAKNGNAKFLRMNRFQLAQPAGGVFDQTNDIICLACHDKGLSWAYSAHANKDVATQTYVAAAAQKREFPSTLDVPANQNPPVWQVACLNCHDTHTVQGARRLLREGTSTGLTGGVQDGLAAVASVDFTKSAIENTCYQCHSGTADVIEPVSTTVPPNIKSDFTGSTYRMPVITGDQGITGTPASSEPHDIGTGGLPQGGANFIEARANLGYAALGNRHAECTDCHNPHRVIKSQNGLPGGLDSTNTKSTIPTHLHATSTTAGYTHSNLISGVLRGAFGVEPDYGAAAANASFHYMPDSTLYKVKSGDPKGSALNDVGQTYVTREYQICLKCHSNYGYDDNNLYDGAGRRPALGGNGRTASGVNGMSATYTNQAKEFQAPTGHAGEPGTAPTNSGAKASFDGGNNHRSWHPVMAPTGRTLGNRGITGTTPWLLPWGNVVSTGVSAVGTNTMYCTDCHGSGVTSNTSVVPDSGKPWGPHGSNNPFLLKGTWAEGKGSDATLLCFKCHVKAVYSGASNTDRRSGFYDSSTGKKNLHNYHVEKLGKELRCSWCHVAVPHGWKNKSFLVNLNDLGPEAGFAGTGNVAPAGSYSKAPYYYKSVLRITSFGRSGNWKSSNCGGGASEGSSSKDYMQDTMCNSLP